jgi:hypothetical protein
VKWAIETTECIARAEAFPIWACLKGHGRPEVHTALADAIFHPRSRDKRI